jgi:phenylalanyl-tRNA synthetase alpha chain
VPRVVDLAEMIEVVATAVGPGAQVRAEPAVHPYTLDGRQIDVRTGPSRSNWPSAGSPHPRGARHRRARSDPLVGLALGLDRAVVLRKGIPTSGCCAAPIRASPRRCATCRRGGRCRSNRPARRDLSLVLEAVDADGELLGAGRAPRSVPTPTGSRS